MNGAPAVRVAFPEVGADKSKTDKEEDAEKKDDEISDIVEVLEDNLLYIAIGGGVLFLIGIFIATKSLSRKRQVVKGYDEP